MSENDPYMPCFSRVPDQERGDTMNIDEKIKYAKSRLGLSVIIFDLEEINKWKKHIQELEEEKKRVGDTMKAEVFHWTGKDGEGFGVSVEYGDRAYSFDCKDEATADMLAHVLNRGVTRISYDKIKG